MPKSKSNRRKKKKSKFVQKQKQLWRMSKPTRNWLELSSDLMLNILQRVSVVDRLQNAQKVCTAWREICKDPAMWQVIYMEELTQYPSGRDVCKEMCKHAVDRSQGKLLDLTMVWFCDHELLHYVADRSSELRRLEIVYFFGGRHGGIWGDAMKKLSLLEELSLFRTSISQGDIEDVGRYCPLLKSLKVNRKALSLWRTRGDDYDDYVITSNEIALAIGKNLPGLTHLELIGTGMNNIGLQAILDGCCHLESLDLRRSSNLDLSGDLGKRCYQEIRNLKLLNDSLEGYLSTHGIYDNSDDECLEYSDYVDDDDDIFYDDDDGGYYDDDDDDDADDDGGGGDDE